MLTTNIPSDKQCQAYSKAMRIITDHMQNVVHIGTKFQHDGYEITLYVPLDQVEEHTAKYKEIKQMIDEISGLETTFFITIIGLYIPPELLSIIQVKHVLPYTTRELEPPGLLPFTSHEPESPVEEAKTRRCPVFNCLS